MELAFIYGCTAVVMLVLLFYEAIAFRLEVNLSLQKKPLGSPQNWGLHPAYSSAAAAAAGQTIHA